MPTRAELKQRAKESMREQQTNPLVVTLVYVLIAIGISLLSALLRFTVIVPLALTIAATILQCGYTYYAMKVSRNEQGDYANLAFGFDTFEHALKLFALTLVVGIFTMLWSFLLFVPGVIKAISYSQSLMILIENPDMPIMDAIRESQRRMNGHKMEYFILELSFIPWGILTSITFGLASFWVVPYTSVTLANYYYDLKAQSGSGAGSVTIEY